MIGKVVCLPNEYHSKIEECTWEGVLMEYISRSKGRILDGRGHPVRSISKLFYHIIQLQDKIVCRQ